jgi:hypothetical protein
MVCRVSLDDRQYPQRAKRVSMTLRVILSALAMLAVLLAPLARPLHESIEASALASAHSLAVDHDHHSQEPHPPHHDSSHCSVCATIGSMRLIAASSAFFFTLTLEPAPRFVVPSYLAPTTHEPAIALVVPRGPPMSV